MEMSKLEKVIKGVHDARRYFEDREWVDKSVGVHIDALNDALDLLKEQEAVVRCKDCKYWSAERINDFNKCRRWINVGVKNFATMGDWFCADGERR